MSHKTSVCLVSVSFWTELAELLFSRTFCNRLLPASFLSLSLGHKPALPPTLLLPASFPPRSRRLGFCGFFGLWSKFHQNFRNFFFLIEGVFIFFNTALA